MKRNDTENNESPVSPFYLITAAGGLVVLCYASIFVDVLVWGTP